MSATIADGDPDRGRLSGHHREWIATVSTWPSNFKYKDMAEVAVDLSKRLRDPEGEHKCDIIIALTHARLVVPPFQ